jgi:hypothetical protein
VKKQQINAHETVARRHCCGVSAWAEIGTTPRKGNMNSIVAFEAFKRATSPELFHPATKTREWLGRDRVNVLSEIAGHRPSSVLKLKGTK